MKAIDIDSGGVYRAKVGGRVVDVEVLSRRVEWRKNGVFPVWVCVNLRTGCEIVVRSAQRFRERSKQGFRCRGCGSYLDLEQTQHGSHVVYGLAGARECGPVDEVRKASP